MRLRLRVRLRVRLQLRVVWIFPLVCTNLSKVQSDGTPCKVYALSPSQTAGLLAIRNFGEQIKEQGARLRLLPDMPNHLAMVLWLEIGALRILLGTDLEETNNPQTGWSVIVSDSTCTQGQASLFKVPHHGSANGHCLAVWKTLLDSKPVALLTPFSKGKSKLPQADDEQRLCNLTDKAYISTAHDPKSSKRPKAVQDNIKRMTKNLSAVPYSTGHIRCRLTLDRPQPAWNISLLNDARPLCS